MKRKFSKVLGVGLTLALLISMLVTAAPVAAEGGTTWYVDDTATGTNDGISLADAFLTIQEGIDTAGSGDTISVAAGTYEETVRINKDNLTIKSISGAEETTITANTALTPGIGCTVQFAVGDDAVDLPEWDGIVTGSVLDGFTVINASGAGDEEGGRPVGVGFPSASGCVAKNLVIEGLSQEDDPHVSGVIFGHDVGDAIGNILENSTISNCYNGFVVYGSGADGNIIRNNIVEGNSNGAWIENETKNTVVQYNDIINNTSLGIGIDEDYWGPSVNISINYNNIYGNGLGIKADYQVLTPPVNATNNWWGNASGPTIAGNPLGSGDAVSANVDYSPWWGASYLTGTAPSIVLAAHPWIWYTNDVIQDAITAATAGDTISVAAGTYTEAVRINKSNLTIKSISGAEETTITANTALTPGIGCTVQFAVGDDAVDLPEWDGIVTGSVLDGFTVINASGQGDEPGGRPVGVGFPSASECVAKNLVIKGLSTDTDPHVSGVIFGHDVGTATGNILENSTISNCWNGFVVYGPGADGNIIRNCTVEDNSNGAWIEYETKNTVVEYNDIINNTLLGIGIDEEYWGPSENISINYNNIYGNGFGIKADYLVLTTPVDATNNWWGNASGPSGTLEVLGYDIGYGDAVSANVDYEPWLLEVVTGVTPTTYEKTLALKKGWTLVSTNKEVTSGTDWVGTEITAVKYAVDVEGGPLVWGSATIDDLKPVDVLCIKTVGGGGVGIKYAATQSGVSSKGLLAGWNLISSGTTPVGSPLSPSAYDVLSPLPFAEIGGAQPVGLTTLVSQGSYNQFSASTYQATLDETDWGLLKGIALNPYDGYWIQMNAASDFGVITD